MTPLTRPPAPAITIGAAPAAAATPQASQKTQSVGYGRDASLFTVRPSLGRGSQTSAGSARSGRPAATCAVWRNGSSLIRSVAMKAMAMIGSPAVNTG